MNKKFTKVTALCSFIIGCMLSSTLFISLNSGNNEPIKLGSPRLGGTPTQSYIDETLPTTDSDNLYIAITNATKTDLGESFSIRFSANTVLYPIGSSGTRKYKGTSGVYVTPNDDSYPSDKGLSELTKYDVDLNEVTAEDEEVKKDESGNPVIDDDGHFALVDGHGYSYQMPIYNAYVSRINCTNTDGKLDTIVIPYSITYGSWFTLRVTEFGENVIFNDRNNENPYDGIKTIVIGNNIEKIPENALPNAKEHGVVVKTTYDEKPSDWNDNFTDGDVEYAYVPDEETEKPVFDMDPLTDENNNILYYDDLGKSLNADGEYLDENGEVIMEENEDGDLVPVVYEGTPITKPKAYEFKAVNPLSKASEKTFVVGNIDEKRGINCPLIMKYKVKLANGNTESRIFECPIDEKDYGYDAIGSDAGKYSLTKNIDIRLNEGEEILEDEIEFYNIFEAISGLDESNNFVIYANLDNAYRNVPSITFANKINISNFFDISYGSIKQVFGYTAISLKVDLIEGIYQQVKTSTFRTYESRINEGKYKIRYSLRDFDIASYHITQGEGADAEEFDIRLNDVVGGGIPGDLDFHLFKQQKNNDLTFFFQDSKISSSLDMNKVSKIELCGFKVSLDLCSTDKGTTQIVTKSGISFRFGYMDLLPKEVNKTPRFNGNLFLIIYTVAFLALYFGLAFGYYQYAKVKYKNDEFRRMNGKAYTKRMAKAFIGAFFIAGAIAFIFLRFTMINPSVIMFNPLDAFVIAFGVSGLISFGYFVKFFVTYVKQERERKKALKLRLNEDVVDDGTR